MTKTIVYAAVFLAVFSMVPPLQSALAGSPTIGASDLGDVSTETVVSPDSVDETLFPVPPTSIEWNPDLGAWVKVLQEVGPCPTSPGQACPFVLRESITVVGEDWSDWHEIILDPTNFPNPPHFQWTRVVVNIDRPNGPDETLDTNDPNTFGNNDIIIDSNDRRFVWMFFDPPLPQGTILDIEKDFDYIGPATQGFIPTEVHQFPTVSDWGDAPDSYKTLGASNGPSHVISSQFLGAIVDPDPDGDPTANADGDDVNDGSDDEDGVAFPGSIKRGDTISISITTTGGGVLDAWIDFDQNGMFDSTERITMASGTTLAGGGNTLMTSIPLSASLGDTYARFRLSSSGGLPPTGPANDGEVEDYKITIEDADGNGDTPIGGTSFQIDTTAVLLAGATSNGFFWLTSILVIAAGVFGVIFYTVRRK